jgi:uncharacterized protein YlaI
MGMNYKAEIDIEIDGKFCGRKCMSLGYSEDNSEYFCIICDYVDLSQSDIKIGNKKQLFVNRYKVYRCDQCVKRFPTRQILNDVKLS